MARPRKAPAEARAMRLVMRVTTAEHLHIDGQALTAGLTAAEFARRAVLGLPVPVRRCRMTDAVLVELIRVGNNINQLTRAANSGLAPCRHELATALTELRAAMERIL
jgi:hypothetical protein